MGHGAKALAVVRALCTAVCCCSQRESTLSLGTAHHCHWHGECAGCLLLVVEPNDFTPVPAEEFCESIKSVTCSLSPSSIPPMPTSLLFLLLHQPQQMS